MAAILFIVIVLLFLLWRFANLKLLTVLWFYEEKNAPEMSAEDITRCGKLVIQHRLKDIKAFLRRK